MATEDKQSTARRNVYFEAGLKEEGQKSSWAESRPKTPLKVYASDLDNESLWLSNSVMRTRSLESSRAVTPRSQISSQGQVQVQGQSNCSPLPLAFLFRHLSGMKSSIGEAMALAKTTASTTSSSSEFSTPTVKLHSYTKVKHRRTKNSALRAMNYPAIVASFLLQHENLTELTIPEDEEMDVSLPPLKKKPCSNSFWVQTSGPEQTLPRKERKAWPLKPGTETTRLEAW